MNNSPSSFSSRLLGCALLLGLPAVAGADIFPDYYLRMGEDDGQPVPGPVMTLKDSVGSAATTSVFGSPRFSTEVGSGAAAATGSTACLDLLSGGRFLKLAGSWPLDGAAGVELWVQPAAATGTSAILTGGAGGDQSWSLMQVDGQFRVRIGSTWFGSAPAVPGRWTHLAVISDGETTTLYADGVACGSGTARSGKISQGLTIGALPPDCTTGFFRGRLDELRYSDHKSGYFNPSQDLLINGPRLSVELGPQGGQELGHHQTLDLNLMPGDSVPLTVRNTGSAPMDGLTIHLEGIDASKFNLLPTQQNPSVLGPGESTTFNVALSRVASGSCRATLHITTRLSTPSYDLTLEGERPAPDLTVWANGQEIPQGLLLNNYPSRPGRTEPDDLSDVSSVSGGDSFFLALRNDGTVTASGKNRAYPGYVPTGLTDIIQVSTGGIYNLALKKDGSVVGWSGYQNELVSLPQNFTGFKAISSKGTRAAGLKADGTVVLWGDDPSDLFPEIMSQTGITAVSLSESCILLLKADGTAMAWGDDFLGSISGVAGQTDIVGIAAGNTQNLLIKKDGTVVQTGIYQDQENALSHIMSAVQTNNLAYLLQDDGTLLSWDGSYASPIPVPGPVRSIAAGPTYFEAVYDPGFTFPDPTAVGSRQSEVIEIANTGALPLHLGQLRLSGPNADDFTISDPGFSSVVAANTGRTRFQIFFQPGAEGLRRAQLDIPTDDPLRPVFSLPLAGTGGTPTPKVSIFALESTAPENQIDPKAVQELNRAQNLSGTSEEIFTVRNDSGGIIDGLNIIAENSSGFGIVPPTETSLAPGASASFTVRFKPEITDSPLVTGLRTAIISIRSNETELIPMECSAYLLDSLKGWRQLQFGTQAATGNAADEADPDHDGIPNLLEYALNGDPLRSDNAANILPQLTLGDNPIRPRPTLNFAYNADRPGQALRVMATTNLVSGNWTEIARGVDGAPFQPLFTGVTVVESPYGPVKGVTISVPAAGDTGGAAPFLFMRLVADSNW